MVDPGLADFYLRLRTEIIVAIYSDDVLAEVLVLKGGNAINLVHRIGQRTSLDVDCSMSADLEDPEAFGRRLFEALRSRLERIGLVLFDEKFGPRPEKLEELLNPRWGGYTARFKLTDKPALARAGDDLAKVRRTARTVAPNPQSQRVFQIELSRFEYCGSTEEKVLNGFTINVYTPQAIAAEKLRAICQQMPGGGRKSRAPRARDFYDIHALVTEAGVNLDTPPNRDLLRKMFEAKDVPLRLLAELETSREFHREEWPSVVDALGGRQPRPFDFYFEFVLEQVARLQALWVEDAP